MMNLINIMLLCLGLLVLNTTLQAQEITVGGEIRPAIEYRHGFKALADTAINPALFIEQRTRINLGFKMKFLETKIVIQDVRTWGSQMLLVPVNGNTPIIHEGWGRVFFHKNFSMKVGRQEIVYDDHRLFGNAGFKQPLSHDAILLVYEDSLMKIHAGFAYNQNGPTLQGTIYTDPAKYKTFQYLWANRQFGILNASFLFINTGVQAMNVNNNVYSDSLGLGRTHYNQTIGAKISIKKDGFAANVSGYYQGGRQNDTINTLGTLIQSYYVAADFSYTINKKYMIGFGAEIFSGNSQVFDPNNPTASSVNRAFNPLFGNTHKFNGYMDYFYVANHAKSVGLNDLYLKFKADIGKEKGFVGLRGHAFIANSQVADPQDFTKPLDSFLGVEVDLYGGFKIHKWAKVKLGYSHMFGTDAMVAIRGGDKNTISNWAWLVITINPSHTFKLKKLSNHHSF